METQHTPGPWRVQSFERGGPGMYSVIIFASVGHDSVKIAEMTMPYRGLEDLENHKKERSKEGLSNARLIAAAPELLEALERINKILPEVGLGDDEKKLSHEFFEACEQVESAIKKAKPS